MFAHLVLGVLRDGKVRHGYDVSGELRLRCGIPSNPGNVYRELSKLSAVGLIEATEKAPEADARRNPYRISLEGCRRFDEWIRSPTTQDDELPAWVAFIDRLPSEDLAPLLEQLQERLWHRTKAIARMRDEALARASHNGATGRHEGAAIRALLELKRTTATLEFVEELRRALTHPTTKATSPSPRRGRSV